MTTYANGKAAALGRISRSRKFIILLVAVAAAFPRYAAAQGAGMIATQACFYYDFTGETYCYVGLVAGDGSGSTSIDNGILPALSADGTKMAYVGYSGLVVLDLINGSLVEVGKSTWDRPALSRDGAKLAFSDGELYVMNADGSNV